MNLKRIIHRSFEEVYATFDIAKVTSWKKAVTTFLAKVDIQVMNRNGFCEPPKVRDRLVKKHTIMLEYFEKRFKDFFESYDYSREIPDCSPDLRERIWVCWWQGEENAPLIVKRCIESIRNSAGGHVVTVITEENYNDYVEFPAWILKKYSEGVITRTNLSDLLRLSLLAKYGGMWLDATFFCSESCCLDLYFKDSLWSIKRPDYLHCSIASGFFAGYSLMCDYQNRYIFVTIRDFFMHYWKSSDRMVDYLLVDYMIVLAQKYDKRIETAFENINPNNPKCDDLFKNLGAVYSEKLWKELSDGTCLFKLSWKQNFPMTIGKDETFYSKILNGTI